MNRKELLVLLLLACHFPVFAQDDMRQAFSDFSKSARGSYETFSKEANEKFAKALKENWETYTLCEEAPRKRRPVPDTLCPVIPAIDEQIDISQVPLEYSDSSQMQCPSTDAAFFFEQDMTRDVRPVDFDYFGVPCHIDVPSSYGSFHPQSPSEGAAASFWEKLSSCNPSSFISQCRGTSSRLRLNDWALFKWADMISEAVYPENVNGERAIFTVFCLNQLGYRAKIARAGSGLLPLFAAKQEVYGRRYALIEGVKYYLPEGCGDLRQLKTYAVELNSSLKALDMAMPQHPEIGGKADSTVSLQSAVLSGRITLPLKSGNVRFYEDYPQLDVNFYALAAPDGDFATALKEAVRKRLEGRSGADAVNMLLLFVQSDFSYRKDTDQFSREKPFFCEENFVYPYNDCEDRVVLLTYLVRSLLGYDCMLLDYKDHINCAVKIPGGASGLYVRRGSDRYYVCDPTYIGASVGQSPKDYRMRPERVIIL